MKKIKIWGQRLDAWDAAHPLLADGLGALALTLAVVSWTLLLFAW